jgi:hypothetical protein
LASINFCGNVIRLSGKELTSATIQLHPYAENTKQWFGRSAGDDIIELGTLEYLNRFKRNLELTGLLVGTWQVSRYASRFCEEFLLFPAGNPEIALSNKGVKLFSKVKYKNSIFIDALKVRLFSPCGKQHEGVASDDGDPALGKGQQIKKRLSWLNGFYGAISSGLVGRWTYRMNDFIDASSPMSFFPPELGGRGLPCEHTSEELFTMFKNSEWCNARYLRLVESMGNSDNVKVARSIFLSISKGIKARGLGKDLQEEAKTCYSLLATLKSCTLKYNAMVDMFNDTGPPDNARRCRDVRDFAHKAGYVTEHEAFLLLEKSYVFKKGLEDPTSLVSGDKRQRKGDKYLLQSLNRLDLAEAGIELSTHNVDELLPLLEKYLKFGAPRGGFLFFYKEILEENFGGLLTPLPPKHLGGSRVPGTVKRSTLDSGKRSIDFNLG